MLEQLIPNVMVKIPKLIQSILETFQMMGWSGSISFVLGLFFGVVPVSYTHLRLLSGRK